ncbi:hypothetical protein EDD86DRAFT_254198 [Gorgonomyces haynaldii]|nr:hypothetical protein EDD86DRAFT_254198 [Gorgonomyces haynaldii]
MDWDKLFIHFFIVFDRIFGHHLGNFSLMRRAKSQHFIQEHSDYLNWSLIFECELEIGFPLMHPRRICKRKDPCRFSSMDGTLYLFNDMVVFSGPKKMVFDLDQVTFEEGIKLQGKHCSMDKNIVYSWIASYYEPAKRWIPDTDSEMCLICHKKFTLTRRRHHCRNCGLLICHGCSIVLDERRCIHCHRPSFHLLSRHRS